MNFKGFFFYFCKSYLWDFERTYTESVNHFGSCRFLVNVFDRQIYKIKGEKERYLPSRGSLSKLPQKSELNLFDAKSQKLAVGPQHRCRSPST